MKKRQPSNKQAVAVAPKESALKRESAGAGIGGRIVPKFSTEAEEAEWWYGNRHLHGKQLLAAVRNGEAQILTREKLLARIAASKTKAAPVISLRVPEADLAMARRQAEQKGLPYQTYIKSLLHETLMAREKRRSKPA